MADQLEGGMQVDTDANQRQSDKLKNDIEEMKIEKARLIAETEAAKAKEE